MLGFIFSNKRKVTYGGKFVKMYQILLDDWRKSGSERERMWREKIKMVMKTEIGNKYGKGGDSVKQSERR